MSSWFESFPWEGLLYFRTADKMKINILKHLQIIGTIFIGISLVFVFLYSNIRIGDSTSDTVTDLLGLRVPVPPQWISYLPGGGFLGWVYEFFSLHGLVRLTIFIIPAYIGSLLLEVGGKKTSSKSVMPEQVSQNLIEDKEKRVYLAGLSVIDDAKYNMDSRLVFSNEEFDLIRKGYERRSSMDYRWYIVTENDCVYILRSWNPFIVFKTQFEQIGNNYVSEESMSQFEVTDKEGHISIFSQNYRNFWIYSLITQLIFNEPPLIGLDSLVHKAKIDFNGVHGFAHWRAVYRNGLTLMPSIDKYVLFYFSVFHDFFRENDMADTAHGKNALYAIPSIEPTIRMSSKDRGKVKSQIEILSFALEHHDDTPEDYAAIKNPLKDSQTVQILLDADRLDLGRVGIVPLSEYLLSEQARKYNDGDLQRALF